MTNKDEISLSSTDRPNILWGLTGSVATIRADRMAEAFVELGNVEAVVTFSAEHFLPPASLGMKIHRDIDEWDQWKVLGDPVLHIELRKWADVLVIAPLSANSMAKLAVGLCDNLLTSVARAWDFSKPMIIAPAMNTMMWNHPVTQTQLDTMQQWGVHVVMPVEKELACRDVGMGALASPEQIADAIRAVIPNASAC